MAASMAVNHTRSYYLYLLSVWYCYKNYTFKIKAYVFDLLRVLNKIKGPVLYPFYVFFFV